MYAWFDWEDETTSVNSLSIIRTPRKPYEEYKPGESVTAKLPQFGLWAGVIVDISQSRSELVEMLNDRQKRQIAEAKETGGPEAVALSEKSENVKKRRIDQTAGTGKKRSKTGDASMTTKGRKNKGTEKENENQIEDASMTTKGRKDKSTEKENGNQIALAKNKEKKRELEKEKLTARKLQLDEVINARSVPVTYEPSSIFLPSHPPEVENYGWVSNNPGTETFTELLTRSEIQDEKERLCVENKALKCEVEALKIENEALRQEIHSKVSMEGFPVTPRKVAFLRSLLCELERHSGMNHHVSSVQRSSSVQQASIVQPSSSVQQASIVQPSSSVQQASIVQPSSSVQQASIVQPSSSIQQASIVQPTSSSVQQASIVQPSSSSIKQAPPIQQAPSVQLTACVQASSSIQQAPSVELNSSVQASSSVQQTSSVQASSSIQQTSSVQPASDQNLATLQPTDREWEKPTTNSGLKKVALVRDRAVFLTQAQLSTALLFGTEPRKLVIQLLEVFFSREQLAAGKATGKRQAHNGKGETTVLPTSVLNAILDFVLVKFRQDSGEAVMTAVEFTKVVNMKCSTARRSLKQ